MFERLKRFVAEKCARYLSPYMDAELKSYRAEMGLGGGGGWLSGGSFDERTALGVASFHSAVKLISELAASLELQVQERVPGTDRWQAVVDHDLEWRLNDAPNSLQTGSAFQRLRYVHLLTHGRTFTVIRWQNGSPAALWPIHPGAFTPIDDELRGRRYQVQFGNRTENLDQSEGIDVLGMSVDGLTPLSPIKQFASPLDLAKGTRDQASTFYANQPKPGVILTSEKRLGDDMFARLEKQLNESYRAAKAGKSLILDGPFKIEQFNPLTFSDYQLLELLAQNDKDIGSKIFNLPPDDLKGYERVEHLEKYVLGPFLLHDAQALSRQLPATADLRRLRIRHNLRGLVDMDIKTRYESYRIAVMTGIMKINEVRGLMNLPPDPKGEELYLPQSVYGKPGTQPVVNPMKGSGGGSREAGANPPDDPAAVAAAEARAVDQSELPLDVNPQFHGMLTDVLASLFTREQHFIQRAAAKPKEWRSEVESWYGKHEATVREKLRHMPEERSRLILTVIGQHRSALLNLALSADLPSSAARVSEHWPGEAAALALTLLEP